MYIYHHLCHHVVLHFTAHTWWYLIFKALTAIFYPQCSARCSTAIMRLYDRTLSSLSTNQYHSPQPHPLKSPFSVPCIWSSDRELHVLRCLLCHVIISFSLNQDWSEALSCGLCCSCIRFDCIKFTLWLCLITDSENKVRGCLLAEWRYHTLSELNQNIIPLH